VTVLLDEDVHHQLRRHLRGHDVATVQRMGWSGIRNGSLITLAVEAGFDVMLTYDRNMEYQQNIKGVNLAIVVIVSRNNRIDAILSLVPAILEALPLLKPGEFVRIE
jgi:O-succinylbenzoate synthase